MTTDQHACNIAGYLASDIIKASLQSALDSYNTSKTIVQAFAQIVALIPAIGVVIDVIAGGAYVLYTALTAGTVGDFTDALADTSLWSNLTCAIYEAIRADGHVTDANFPTLRTNIADTAYVHAEVITTITAYVDALGASGLEHAQQPGGLNTADCTGCGTWCYLEDYTLAPGSPTSYGSPPTVWTAGQGWVGQYAPGSSPDSTAAQLQMHFSSRFIGNLRIGTVTPAGAGLYSVIAAQLAGADVYRRSGIGFPAGGAITLTDFPINAVCDSVYIIIASPGNVSPPIFKSYRFTGSGANPFGETNC